MTKHTCALLNAILSLGFILSFSNLITCLGSTGPQVHFSFMFCFEVSFVSRFVLPSSLWALHFPAERQGEVPGLLFIFFLSNPGSFNYQSSPVTYKTSKPIHCAPPAAFMRLKRGFLIIGPAFDHLLCKNPLD